ncbi:universal stress protein [Variovorax sp. J22R133]|nr:universal stress protein [Variovorax sp. J22R133]MDM0116362.1 universal stress protein [Variovorax sp. J22R133]
MYQRILVPVDGSATSNHGLDEAIRMATLTHGHVRVMHCIDGLSFAYAMDAYAGVSGGCLEDLRRNGAALLEAADNKVAAAGLEAETVLFDGFGGSVADMVIKEAASWNADLIVIGTHGRRGVGRVFMGSSAEQVLRMAPVPVLLVRAQDAEKRPETEAFPQSKFERPTGAAAIAIA